MNDAIEKELTEGEEIIAQFFEDAGITYKTDAKLVLPGDIKSFRVPDFYLPRFKLYVEFFGQWNVNEMHRERYREKKRVYHLNKIPCIYLYPENLGCIEQIIHIRMKKELEAKGMTKQLIRFRHYQLKDDLEFSATVFIISAVFLFFWLTREIHDVNWIVNTRIVVLWIVTFFCTAGLVGIFTFIIDYVKILVRKRI